MGGTAFARGPLLNVCFTVARPVFRRTGHDCKQINTTFKKARLTVKTKTIAFKMAHAAFLNTVFLENCRWPLSPPCISPV